MREPDRGGSYVFFAVVASIVLLLDVATKAWAEMRFEAVPRAAKAIVVIEGHLAFTLAYNKGGAWGLFRDFSDWIRKPFFLAVSAIAIAFLVSLFGRLRPGQRCLRWGLPLVLGGALGNLSDRVVRAGVVDFIDYRGVWVEWMNRGIATLVRGWTVTDHWPTFNVADIGISVGVFLMAIDMLLARQDNGGRASSVDGGQTLGAGATGGAPASQCTPEDDVPTGHESNEAANSVRAPGASDAREPAESDGESHGQTSEKVIEAPCREGREPT